MSYCELGGRVGGWVGGGVALSLLFPCGVVGNGRGFQTQVLLFGWVGGWVGSLLF